MNGEYMLMNVAYELRDITTTFFQTEMIEVEKSSHTVRFISLLPGGD